MHCPECGGEYRTGIVDCPTCEVPLVEERVEGPAPAREPRIAPVLLDLVGFIDEHEARDARGRLRAARITSELVIRDAPASASSVEDGEAADEYWIRVPASQAHAAAEVLELQAVLSEDACPFCGAPVEGEGDCPRCGHRLESE